MNDTTITVMLIGAMVVCMAAMVCLVLVMPKVKMIEYRNLRYLGIFLVFSFGTKVSILFVLACSTLLMRSSI